MHKRTNTPLIGIALIGCASLGIIVVAVGLVALIAITVSARTMPTAQAALAPTVALATQTSEPTSAPNHTLAQPVMPTDTPAPPPVPTSTATSTPTPAPTASPTATPPVLVVPPDAIVPDGALVNGPDGRGFSISGFVAAQPGFIRAYTETILGRTMAAPDIVRFVSVNTSVSPRLLLALLEYRGGWLSNAAPVGDALSYPLGHVDAQRSGLMAQLIWAANALNEGYCGFKTRGVTSLTFLSGGKRKYAAHLNAGTLAVQYFLAQTTSADQWSRDILPTGFRAVYTRLFGDPFAASSGVPVPPDLAQPVMQLPFAQGEQWRFSGGPHGGWDRRGSAWGAVDFAPPLPSDEVLRKQGKCHVSPYFARAVADGIIVRAADGAVVLDLDMDNDERTGWAILYLHIARQDRAQVGAVLKAGDPVGRPSCEGFYLYSPGTHLHISRRYNGEWIATDCPACLPGVAAPPFVMSGWRPFAEGRQVSMGWMERLPDAPNIAGIARLVRLGDKIAW